MRLLRLRVAWLPASMLAATLGASALSRGFTGDGGDPPRTGPHPVITERAVTELVLIETYVTEAGGRPVTGLEADDFVLVVDGHRSPIATFESRLVGPGPLDAGSLQVGTAQEQGPKAAPVEPPRRFMLFFEDGLSAPAGLTAARRAALQFLATGLLPQDQVGIAAYDTGLRILHDFTTDRDALKEVIDRSLHDARRASDYVVEQKSHDDEFANIVAQVKQTSPVNRGGDGSRTRDVVRQVLGGLGSGKQLPPPQEALLQRAKSLAVAYGEEEAPRLRGVLDALRTLVDSMAAWRGYKAIVYMGDGLPENPSLPYVERILEVEQDSKLLTRIRPLSLSSNLQDLLQAAAAAGVTIHTLQTRGLEAGDSREMLAASRRSNSLESIALGTGGMTSSSNDFVKALGGFETGSRSYYVLGYQPQGEPDGRFHTVQVQCRKKGALLRWRKGFTRLKPEEALQRTILAAYTVPEMYPQLRIGLSAVAGPALGSGRIMDLVVHVPGETLLYRTEDGRSTAHLEVGLVAMDDLSKDTMKVSRQIGVALPAGEGATGQIGINLTHRIRLPASSQTITAVVYDAAAGVTGAARLVVPAATPAAVRVSGLSIYSLRQKSLWIDLPQAGAAEGAGGTASVYTIGPALKDVYAPDEPLVCGFRMSGDDGNGGSHLEVAIRRGETTVRTVAIDRRNGGTDDPVHVPLPTSGLPPGEYTVAVQEILTGGPVDRGAVALILRPVEAPAPSTAAEQPL